MEVTNRGRICRISHKGDRDRYPIAGCDRDQYPISGSGRALQLIWGVIRSWKVGVAGRKQRSRTLSKPKIATTPISKYFDPDQTPAIVVYASKWAVSAALLQKHEKVYWPVTVQAVR